MQLLFLRFSRDDEHQADQLGVRYMGRVGYDPAQLSGVMAMLSEVTSAGGGGGMPEWLSTHPNPENRVENILEMAAEAEVAADPALVRRAEYVPFLDGMIYGENPREGFFRGSRFYHPDLAFILDFPAEWRTANSKQAVQGLSPQEDALMALTLGEGASPEAALRTFLAQEGMTAGPLSQRPINGRPAAAADFRFTSPEGTLEGRVAFLQHGNLLFRLLGYGTSSVWSERSGAVRGAVESFRPLTDRQFLDVEPARIRVVTLSRASDLASVLAREGAEDRAQDVRLLNRLQGNPDLPAGRTLKIPVGGRLPGGL
jgi:predicted Zn-dependent protease